MKQYKTINSSKKETSSGLDRYNYSKFDDDYHYDLVEERAHQRAKRKRPSRRKSDNVNAFHNYMKDY